MRLAQHRVRRTVGDAPAPRHRAADPRARAAAGNSAAAAISAAVMPQPGQPGEASVAHRRAGRMDGGGASARPGTPSGPAADAARAGTAPGPADPIRPRPRTPGPASLARRAAAPSSTDPVQHVRELARTPRSAADRHGQPRRRSPGHPGLLAGAGHRIDRGPQPGRSRDAGKPATTRPRRARAGRRPRRSRLRHRQRCCRRHVAAGAGAPRRPARPAATPRPSTRRSRPAASARRCVPRNRLTNTKSLPAACGDTHALELVGVERLHHKEIQRHHPLPAGLGPRPVRVVLAAHHMQMRPRHLAPQRRESTSRCTSLRRNPHTSPRRSPARAISNTISRSRADRHARSSATISLVAGPIDRRFRFPQPMPGPHPPRHPTVLAAGLRRQVPVVGDLIQHRHQPRRRRARSRPRAPPCPAPRSAHR